MFLFQYICLYIKNVSKNMSNFENIEIIAIVTIPDTGDKKEYEH